MVFGEHKCVFLIAYVVFQLDVSLFEEILDVIGDKLVHRFEHESRLLLLPTSSKLVPTQFT